MSLAFAGTCRALKHLRGCVGRPLDRWLAGREPVTIISEDCWGGEFCRSLGCAYATPLAGAFIPPEEYLTFLENFGAEDAFQLQPVATSAAYPVGRTPYATVHFMHAATWTEAASAFARRAARINPERLFFKIDFGKAGYLPDDVLRWNKLALRNGVALVPPDPQPGFDFKDVRSGWRIPKWSYDGADMFHLSRRAFDFHHWLRTGHLRRSWCMRLLNFLWWDRLAPSEVIRRCQSVLAQSAAPR